MLGKQSTMESQPLSVAFKVLWQSKSTGCLHSTEGWWEKGSLIHFLKLIQPLFSLLDGYLTNVHQPI